MDVWRTMVSRDWRTLARAPSEVREDRETLFDALSPSWGWALQFASSDLRAECSLVFEAVRQDGLTLQFADVSLQADRIVVLEAVSHNGWALEHAAESLRADAEVVIVATRQSCGQALAFASPRLLLEKSFWQSLVRQFPRPLGRVLTYLPTHLRGDLDFMTEAVHKDWRALAFASVDLKHDRGLVRVAVRQNWESLVYAAEELKTDRELLNSVARPGESFDDVPIDQLGPRAVRCPPTRTTHWP